MTGAFKTATHLVATKATWGRDQNFLGARWVPVVVERTPSRYQMAVVRRLLSLSPHYIYDRDLRAEVERNRRSRQEIIDTLVAPRLDRPDLRVLDYGCGPGFAARAVAGYCAHVDAVDISGGVIACAKVLNGRDNVSFWTTEQYEAVEGVCDLAYSFAVFQHLSTDTLNAVLTRLVSSIRPGGLLIAHFAAPENGWRTEAEWQDDRSYAGRTRLKYGLNCFGRTPEEMVDTLESHGFEAIEVRRLTGALETDADIESQYLLEARNPGR